MSKLVENKLKTVLWYVYIAGVKKRSGDDLQEIRHARKQPPWVYYTGEDAQQRFDTIFNSKFEFKKITHAHAKTKWFRS